jgi:excisionase family DNA binding protein
MRLENSDSAAMADANQPLTETEAAARLGLKVATLRAWRHQGRGPAYVRLGRAIRYLANDIDEFLHSNRHNPRSRPEPLGADVIDTARDSAASGNRHPRGVRCGQSCTCRMTEVAHG